MSNTAKPHSEPPKVADSDLEDGMLWGIRWRDPGTGLYKTRFSQTTAEMASSANLLIASGARDIRIRIVDGPLGIPVTR